MIAGLPKLRYILLSAFLILVFVVATVTAVQQEKKCTTGQSQFSYQKMNQVLNQQESQNRYAYQKKVQSQNSYQKMSQNGLGQNEPQEHQGSENSGNNSGNGNGGGSGNTGGSGNAGGNSGGNGKGK